MSWGSWNPPGEPTSRSNVAPAGDPGVHVGVEGAPGGRQAHRLDVRGKSHLWWESQQGDVVVKGPGDVVRMIDDLRYAQRHLVGVGPLLALTAQIHRHAAGRDPAETATGADVSALVRPSVCAGYFCLYPPCEAVGSAQHPLVVDEGASAAVAPKEMHADLPGPAALWGHLSSYDPGVKLRSTTHCRRAEKAPFQSFAEISDYRMEQKSSCNCCLTILLWARLWKEKNKDGWKQQILDARVFNNFSGNLLEGKVIFPHSTFVRAS